MPEENKGPGWDALEILFVGVLIIAALGALPGYIERWQNVRAPFVTAPDSLDGYVIPPRSVAEEQSLLGSLLRNPFALDDVSEQLSPDDIIDERDRLIYQAMLELKAEGKPVNIATVANKLREKGQLDDVGGMGYLKELYNAGIDSPPALPIPPEGDEEERQVIGAILSDPSQVDDIAELLDANDFDDPRNALIFTTIEDLRARGEPVNVATVAQELKKEGLLDDAGGIEYINELFSLAREKEEEALPPLPPETPEEERALIEALLRDPSKIDDVSSLVSPTDFSDRKNRIIYNTIRKLDDEGEPVDADSIIERLREDGLLSEAGGERYVRSVAKSALEESQGTFRLPPNNTQEERVLLGSLLKDPSIFDEMSGLISSGDFTDPRNRAVYEAMLALHDEGKTISIDSVEERLEEEGQLEGIGGRNYLERLVDDASYIHPRGVRRALDFKVSRTFIYSILLSLLFLTGIVYSVMRLMYLQRKKIITLLDITPEDKGQYDMFWEEIQKLMHTEDPRDWKEAILRADEMLVEMVNKMGYNDGETLLERLKEVEVSDFETLPTAREAHRLKEEIVSGDVTLEKRHARKIIFMYEQVFREFEYI